SIGVASLLVNAGFKSVARRKRPDRQAESIDRHVPMPESTSFPSGHSASAFAFAQGVSSVSPAMSVPLHMAALAVAYSRVHTGVHYPGDVVAGSLIGIVTGGAVSRILARRLPPPG
ncbi:MAG TPA: phosphatase PAP2 family protein, partial [Actinomycetota bacterium]|nr:phosphatase PAP2 family protein [Actinomycetota bacterium]